MLGAPAFPAPPLQGELPKACPGLDPGGEGVPLPIDYALNHPYGCSLPI